MKRPTIGFLFHCQLPPEQLTETARRVEALGFDDLWIVEDCFFGGGITSVATALAATSTLRLGLGIMPAVARNVAFTAMELATLARLYPHRTLPGIGHGVTTWMRQIGAWPTSPLQALEETISALRALLRGERVHRSGQTVRLEDVQLAHPPTHVPPLFAGVRAIRSLQLAGRVADGTILSEGSSPSYVRWARQQIREGMASVHRTGRHAVVVYTLCHVASDPVVARQVLRPHIAKMVADGALDSQLAPLELAQEIKTRIQQEGKQRFMQAFPDEWVDQLAVVGTPDLCIDAIGQLTEAGADSIVLVPLLEHRDSQLDVVGREILPRLLVSN
jgi:5,10-methylenetetrahydromethanopterin reductase